MKYNRIAEDKSQLEGFAQKIEDNGWASVGVVVLPVPHDEMTWEQYKDEFGIDLHEIFKVRQLGAISIVEFKTGYSKILALGNINYPPFESGSCPNICLAASGEGTDDDDHVIHIVFSQYDNSNQVLQPWGGITVGPDWIRQYEI